MNDEYDIAVIGAGPGGYPCAIRASQLGLKVACIEKGETLGGTCLNVGCIPSKALLYSSEVYSIICNDASVHGIDLKNPSFDLNRFMDRKKKVIKTLTDSLDHLFEKNKIRRFKGTAFLESANTIQVQEKDKTFTINAKNIVLATGSVAISLPFLPFDEKRIISSTGALSLDHIPQKMVVIGAGIIGVELASCFSRLGSKVTVVELLPTICAGIDATLRNALLSSLKKQGIDFLLGAQVLSAETKGKNIKIEVLQDGKKQEITGDTVLVSVGRRPNSQGLNLEKVGVKLTPKGFVEVDKSFQTSLPNIFAIGDLIDGPMLAHRASEEGIALAEMITGQRPKLDYMTIPNVIYTTPELATVGLTEDEAKNLGFSCKIGKAYFKGNPRAIACGNVDGLVKIVADSKTDRLLGFHIFAVHASEMIGQGVLALAKKVSLKELGDLVFAHPTYSEAIKEAALQAEGKAIHI